ncbi:MAG TPA: ribulokinase [Victivallales bacterium]|nr:ribulokinase [Victivallales bacterium]
MKKQNYVIGVDFGTDSARAIVIDASNGDELASAVHNYNRWNDGKFSSPKDNIFRQHPLDYIEALENTIKTALKKSGKSVSANISGIAVDTTGSTPVAVDSSGSPLSLHKEFEREPDAMFILWKDHSSINEAQEINQLAHSGKFEDYTKFSGGIYSSEWFWAKILHTIRRNKKVAKTAYSWLEHCDWIPALLCGIKKIEQIKRSRCAAGHKAMWHQDFGGLPSYDFLKALDPRLAEFRDKLYSETYPSDQSAGFLSREWAERLGIKSEKTAVAVGAFDAHMGAVGGEIKPGILVKIIGTSTCDMLVSPLYGKEKLIRGICGQVDGSIIPGMLGLEAGQSAFGDFYAWFRNLLLWPISESKNHKIAKFASTLKHEILGELNIAASKIKIEEDIPVFTDWINGRRTPFADQSLKASAIGFDMGTNAPMIFRSIVEATAFGAKKINECFTSQGVQIKEIIALGGIAKKPPFVMQTLSDVLEMPVKVVRSEQACALGAAMFAAVVGGIYQKVEDAQDAMGSGFEKNYKPNKKLFPVYRERYKKYLQLANATEKDLKI